MAPALTVGRIVAAAAVVSMHKLRVIQQACSIEMEGGTGPILTGFWSVLGTLSPVVCENCGWNPLVPMPDALGNSHAPTTSSSFQPATRGLASFGPRLVHNAQAGGALIAYNTIQHAGACTMHAAWMNARPEVTVVPLCPHSGGCTAVVR